MMGAVNVQRPPHMVEQQIRGRSDHGGKTHDKHRGGGGEAASPPPLTEEEFLRMKERMIKR